MSIHVVDSARPQTASVGRLRFQIRDNLQSAYADVFTPAALEALSAMASFNKDQQELIAARIERRMRRFRNHEKIAFLDADASIPRTQLKVRDAREGKFVGSGIPADLERQWIQGTGPAAKPNAPVESSIRNVAYALLSGADGWMFDGEDALGHLFGIADNPHSDLLGQANPVGVDIDPDDHSRPRQPGPLNDIQPDTAQAEDHDRIADLHLGGPIARGDVRRGSAVQGVHAVDRLRRHRPVVKTSFGV